MDAVNNTNEILIFEFIIDTKLIIFVLCNQVLMNNFVPPKSVKAKTVLNFHQSLT